MMRRDEIWLVDSNCRYKHDTRTHLHLALPVHIQPTALAAVALCAVKARD